MKKGLIILLCVVCIILILPLPTVLAQAYTQFSFPAVGDTRYGHPQLASVTTSSGRFVYAYGDDTTYTVYVLVYSATGVLLGTVSFSVNSGCAHGHLDMKPVRLSMIEVSASEVLISMAIHDDNADRHHNHGVALVDIDAFTYALDWGTEQVTVQGAYDMYPSQIFQNGTNFYGIVTFDYLNDDSHEHWRWRFVSATGTLSDTYDTTNDICGQIFGFQDESDDTLVYLIGADEADENRTVAVTWDLDTWNSDPNFLANAPFNNIWYHIPQTASYDPDIHYRKRLRYIDGGAFWNATEDQYFLWFTWARAQDTTNDFTVVQWRTAYNSSGYDSLYLEENNRVTADVDSATGFPTLPVSIHGGFHQQDDRDTFFITVESRFALPNTYRPRTYTMQMVDWFNFGATTMSTTDNEWGDDFYLSVDDIRFQEPTETFAVVEEYGESWGRVFFGLTPEFEGYDVDALTYTPADPNPEINKRYVFSTTVTLNDIGYQSEVSIYIDDIVISSRTTEANGDFDFWVQTSVLGAHNITIEVFDDGESEYTETTIYVWVDSTADEDTQMLNLGMGSVVNFIVLFALCGVPAFLLMQQAGMMGFFAGLALGGIIGFVGGIMPMYGLMLVGLICAVGMIYGRRTPTGTGEV